MAPWLIIGCAAPATRFVFDDTAMKAMREAKSFGPVPPGLLRPDGRFRFTFSFFLYCRVLEANVDAIEATTRGLGRRSRASIRIGRSRARGRSGNWIRLASDSLVDRVRAPDRLVLPGRVGVQEQRRRRGGPTRVQVVG